MRRLPHLEHCHNQTAQHLQTVLPFGELLTIAWPIIGKSDVIHKKRKYIQRNRIATLNRAKAAGIKQFGEA